MTLRLFDTRSRSVRDFEPLEPGQVGIYVCGPTVQSPPHIGHLRSAINFDILRRWLLASGYSVTLIRNVTDIDDKIIHNAGHEDTTWWELATRNTREFQAAYDAVRVLPPTGEPRATGHVTEMVTLMQTLIERGHAYDADGDVWFSVRSLPSYGELSGQRPDAMLATEVGGAKRDPLDFALWKSAKPGEPSWETPWGPGRPGWHLECSAMATKYLGEAFDIHGGGHDLVFPHHENELAQSTAAGHPFANFWLHHGLVNTGGSKMSKSLGNSLIVMDVLQRARPQALRYVLGAPQLRSDLDWSEALLTEAETAYSRIEGFLARAAEVVGPIEIERVTHDDVPPEFAAAMDDDLSVPRALSVLHNSVRDGNAALASGDKAAVAELARAVAAMTWVLGINPAEYSGSTYSGSTGDDALRRAIDGLVPAMLDGRAAARARGDYAEADRIRDALGSAGVLVEDTADGVRWRLG